MERLTSRNPHGRAIVKDFPAYEEYELVTRLAAIEDILGDDYDFDRLRELAQADKLIGKEVWAQAKYLNIWQTKRSDIQRTTIQYISLLKGGDVLCHTQTCAFPLNEVGKTVFLTREEAEAALEGIKND